MKIKTSEAIDVEQGAVAFMYKGYQISLAKWESLHPHQRQGELMVFPSATSWEDLYQDSPTIEGIIRAAAFIDKLVKEPKA